MTKTTHSQKPWADNGGHFTRSHRHSSTSRWQGQEQGSSDTFSYTNLSYPDADPQRPPLIRSVTR
jgi:hypothetical protein